MFSRLSQLSCRLNIDGPIGFFGTPNTSVSIKITNKPLVFIRGEDLVLILCSLSFEKLIQDGCVHKSLLGK